MNMSVLETLFYPLTQGLVPFETERHSCAFLNAQGCEGLEKLGGVSLFLQQYFKPYTLELQDRGLHVSSEITAGDESSDLALVALPKNVLEARYLAAQALRILKPGGTVICAADNKAGGTRIQKMLQEFGCTDVQDFSKNKARVVWGKRAGTLNDAALSALKEGEVQPVLDGEYLSMPGIFGWDKIDKGSEILLQHLPEDLSGQAADFGCGYGYLSRHVLQCAGIESLACIDADFRAMKLCQENLKEERAAQIRYFWEDLTKPLTGLRDLDFIVMNPPFHEGKKTDTAIGTSFIKTAVYTLQPGGKLWMVANAGLPYEDVLASTFSRTENIFEGDGFKVFCATK